MKCFEVSAPGKIILHGEHSVVYGKPAIAGPIGLRTHLKFKEIDAPEARFDFESISFRTSISLQNLNLFLSELNCFEIVEPIDFLHKFRADSSFIMKYIDVKPEEESIKEKFSIGTTLYLMNRILLSEKITNIRTGFEISIKSSMSIGAGLGSSASYAVCVAAGIYVLSQILTNKITDDNFSLENNEILDKISKWAFDSEIVMHEKPSGIDNTICTFGNLIKFTRGQPVESIKLHSPIDIIIVDTGVSRTTSKLVANVVELKRKHPKLVDSIMEAMGYLVDDVIQLLEGESRSFDDLKNLVAMNNNLLRAIGVSHPSLEEIFRIAEAHGFNAKLTGAGGGGCALIFLEPNHESLEEYQNLIKCLTDAKLSWMKTTIGGTGLKFHHIE